MSATERSAAWRRRTRQLSPYLLSGVEQALWSVMNVGVGLLLIRLAAPAQYGAFVFWSNAAFVLSSFQNALTVTHLLVLPPGRDQQAGRQDVERLMLGVTLVFLAVVAVAVLGLTAALRRAGDPIGVTAAALFIPAFLLQQKRQQPWVRAVRRFHHGKANFPGGRPLIEKSVSLAAASANGQLKSAVPASLAARLVASST